MNKKDEARAALERAIDRVCRRLDYYPRIVGKAIDAYGAACAEEAEQRGYERGRAEQPAISDVLDDLDAWAHPPDLGIVGAGLYWEKWPSLTPSARKLLARYVDTLRSRPQPKREEE